jgi:hypothetical protein
MIQAGEDPGLLLEPAKAIGIAGAVGGEDL